MPEYAKYTALLPQFIPSPVYIFCGLSLGAGSEMVQTLSLVSLLFVHDTCYGGPPHIVQVRKFPT